MEYIELFTTLTGVVIIILIVAIMLILESRDSAVVRCQELDRENKRLKRRYDALALSQKLKRDHGVDV